MSRWLKSKTSKPCNVFPSVWAAIVGCTGTGTHYRYAPEHMGVSRPEFACPTCRAATDRFDALTGKAYADALRAASEAAGCPDYRVAEVRHVDGRPVLTGRIDVHLAREAALDALHGYSGGNDASHAIAALRVFAKAGGDCRPLVESMRLPARALTALRAAWRSSAA